MFNSFLSPWKGRILFKTIYNYAIAREGNPDQLLRCLAMLRHELQAGLYSAEVGDGVCWWDPTNNDQQTTNRKPCHVSHFHTAALDSMRGWKLMLPWNVEDVEVRAEKTVWTETKALSAPSPLDWHGLTWPSFCGFLQPYFKFIVPKLSMLSLAWIAQSCRNTSMYCTCPKISVWAGWGHRDASFPFRRCACMAILLFASNWAFMCLDWNTWAAASSSLSERNPL